MSHLILLEHSYFQLINGTSFSGYASFLIDGKGCSLMGLCLLRSLMVFQGEIPGSKTPLQLWPDRVTLMEGSDGI